MLGASAVFARNTIPYRATVQSAGKAHRMRLKTLKQALPPEASFRKQLQFYLQAVHTQVAQSAICNRFHTIQERIAKWLLLSADRTGNDELCYTHEFLSMILGARRTTVTRTVRSLHIRAGRGSITIKKRKHLESIACECYAIVRTEFQQLN
jgi:CRP-like cAMP-binding protein